MSLFIFDGNSYTVSDNENIQLVKELPAGNYVLRYSDKQGYYLDKIQDFSIPTKIYGEVISDTARFINTFKSRSSSTGILLWGDKGSGKTLQAKHVCSELAKEGIPTIIINHAFNGNAFNIFINDIKQECIVFFDEFEKVYNFDAQDMLLTLFDGVFDSKKLFMITANSHHKISDNIFNRPSRFYYAIGHGGVTEALVKDYCEDRLVNKNLSDDVWRVTSLLNEFNFDMLQCLVEEMNRYNESAKDALQLLNIDPDPKSTSSWKIINCKQNGIDFDIPKRYEDVKGDMHHDIGMYIEIPVGDDEVTLRCCPEYITKYDHTTQQLEYKLTKNDNLYEITLKRVTDFTSKFYKLI